MFSFLIFFTVLGVLILVHEFGHFLVARFLGIRVEVFSLGFGPKLFKKKRGDTEWQLCLIPLGGFVKMAGDSAEEHKGAPDEFLSQSPSRRAAVVFFGPVLNYILGFLCFWLIFFAGYPSLTTKVGTVLDNYGAKEAGVLSGDRVTAIDGKEVALWEDLQQAIQGKKEHEAVRLSLLRDNSAYVVSANIKVKEITDALGKKHSIGLLGLAPSGDFVKVRHGPIASFILGAKKTWEWTGLTLEALLRMITGRLSMRESMTGPLGLFLVTSKAASAGLVALLHLVAVLNINLAIFNLLPLPVLDGGHIFLLLIEKIRGKILSVKVERLITRIGLTLILTLVVVVTYNDILRFFGDKIGRLLK